MQEVSEQPQSEQMGGRNKAFLVAAAVALLGAIYWLIEFEQSKALYQKQWEAKGFSHEVTNELARRFQPLDLGWKTKQEVVVVGAWLAMVIYFWWASGLLRKGRTTKNRPLTFWLGAVVFGVAVAVVIGLIGGF